MSEELERTPYTTAELAAIVERAEAATPFTDCADNVMRYDHGGGRIALLGNREDRKLIADLYHENDREFFIAARSDVPRLAAEVIALRKALREVREWFVMATAPGNAGDDFVNDDGWEKATNIAAGLRALMPPEPS